MFSCSKSRVQINDTFIREISEIDRQNSPNVISATPSAAIQLVFVKLNNGNIYATNGLELYNIYVDNYKKNTIPIILFKTSSLSRVSIKV